jgi:tRNA pseudouridine55 synthase
MQKPPIYSALRVEGKRLYEYAREGKEIPIQIKERPVSVLDIEVTEWMDGGTHPWHWPEREAEFEEKEIAKKALKALHPEGKAPAPAVETSDSAKRTREASVPVADGASSELSQKRARLDADTAGIHTGGAADASAAAASSTPNADEENVAPTAGVSIDELDTAPKAVRPPCPAPACRIRMDVTSGFYVRSLCHDLGAEVGSLGLMASLVRTRQGQFKLGENVLPYEDVSKGEDVWAPKVESLLRQWQENESEEAAT